MSAVLNVGEMLSVNARLYPDRAAVKDLARSLTYAQYEARANRLANGLPGWAWRPATGSLLAYNCVEWMEIYAALARVGLVAVPINFRLASPEVGYIVQHSEARALIVQARTGRQR